MALASQTDVDGDRGQDRVRAPILKAEGSDEAAREKTQE